MIQIQLRVQRVEILGHSSGVLVPLGRLENDQLRDAQIKVGDVLNARLTKSRNPGFHRYAHALAQIAIDSVDGFEGMQAHAVLKRLQLESGAGCESLMIDIGNGDQMQYRIPKSLSFSSMDEIEFKKTVVSCARYLAERYMPNGSTDELNEIIDDLLSGMEGGAA